MENADIQMAVNDRDDFQPNKHIPPFKGEGEEPHGNQAIVEFVESHERDNPVPPGNESIEVVTRGCKRLWTNTPPLVPKSPRVFS